MSKKLVMFGTQETADVIDFYFTHDSDYEVVAFTADGAFVKADSHNGRPLVPFEDLERFFPALDHDIYVAVGFQKMNAVRARVFSDAKAKGYRLASYLSSKASAWPGLKLGENTFIMENNVIQPFATIGENTILWSGNHIGHHAVIGSHCFVSSHVVVSGRVHVGDYSFLGVNSTLRDGVSLGEATLVGAGALVLTDTKAEAVLMGQGAEPRSISSRRLRGF